MRTDLNAKLREDLQDESFSFRFAAVDERELKELRKRSAEPKAA